MSDFDTFQLLLGPGDPAQIGKGKKKPLPDSHTSAERLEGWLAAYARKLAEVSGEVRPRVMAVCANGDVVELVNPSQFAEEDKQRWVRTCRRAFKEWNVKHYGMLSEGTQTAEGPEGQIPPPLATPVEVVMIITADRRGRKRLRTMKIERDATGNIATLTGMITRGQEWGGRMFALLDDYDPNDGFATNPCETAEFNQFYEMAQAMCLGIRDFPEKFGSHTERLATKGEALAKELTAAYERLKATPADDLREDSGPLKAYTDIRERCGALILEMKPFFTKETQDGITKLQAERAARAEQET